MLTLRRRSSKYTIFYKKKKQYTIYVHAREGVGIVRKKTFTDNLLKGYL